MSSAVAATPPRRRISFALILATLVTLAVATPLAFLAWQADDGEVPEVAEGLSFDAGNGAEPLSGSMVPGDPATRLLVDVSGIEAASWVITYAKGDEVAAGEDAGTAPLALSVALDQLDQGRYDLLVAIRHQDGTTTERAARFEIGDPG